MQDIGSAIHTAIDQAVAPLRAELAELRAEVGRRGADLLPAELAAARLGMSPGALRRAATRGGSRRLRAAGVEVVRLGRRLRFRIGGGAE